MVFVFNVHMQFYTCLQVRKLLLVWLVADLREIGKPVSILGCRHCPPQARFFIACTKDLHFCSWVCKSADDPRPPVDRMSGQLLDDEFMR